jgi:hypothetical protein
MRHGVCPLHMKADIIVQHGVGGTLENMRFCHQCGRLEPLHAFIGSQRSCAASLHKKRSNVKRDKSKTSEGVGPSISSVHPPAGYDDPRARCCHLQHFCSMFMRLRHQILVLVPICRNTNCIASPAVVCQHNSARRHAGPSRVDNQQLVCPRHYQ